MSLDETEEDKPRTAFDLIRDFVEYLLEHEWEDAYESCPRACCREWVRRCPECKAINAGERYTGGEDHKKGCRWKILLTEAEAMLEDENAQLESEEASRRYQLSRKTSWDHLD